MPKMVQADAQRVSQMEVLPVERSGVRAFDEAARDSILLLDDDPASLRLMQEVLWTAGYECIATHVAEEALSIVAGSRPIKVVISDICMPDIDGLMFLDRLNLLRLKQLPRVLFLTGHPTLDRAVAALRLGASDFLVKPTRPRELLDAVERACGRGGQTTNDPADDSWTVESLAKEAEALAARLRMMTASAVNQSDVRLKLSSPTLPTTMAAPISAATLPSVPTAPSDEAQRQLRTAQLLDTMEQLRRLRRRNYSGLEDMDDIAWELLMEVLRSSREGRQISVSGLTISVEGVSPTTALRRTNELVARGYLHRIPDPTDARRDFVTLDPKTRAALEDYLARAAEHLG
jgi:CheY-like chemotaxis protein